MKRDRATPSGLSRRRLMKVSASLAAGAALAQTLPTLPAAAASDDAPLRPPGRILFKGGTIISMDARVGDIATGDLLIDGKKIVAVGGTLYAADALVIDATNAILIPG